MKPPDHRQAADSVAAYYDRNTPRFLRLGGSGETAAIHRAVWAEGVKDKAQAFLYLNQVVAEAVAPALEKASPARLLDLGCGVGGTATWLASRLPVQVAGITNSAVQRQAAVERAARLGLNRQCTFLLADFMDLPPLDLPQPGDTPRPGARPEPDEAVQPGGLANAAYAIEAFVHAPDARRFFQQVRGKLIPGGRLVICDDFLSPAGASGLPGSPPARWLERFRRDWRIHNLLTADQANGLAQQAGFNLLQSSDLTPYIRSFHPVLLYMLTTLTRLPLPSAYWQNLSGGAALQVCIRRGWTQYRALVWEKEE